jgi:hypothetical protein
MKSKLRLGALAAVAPLILVLLTACAPAVAIAPAADATNPKCADVIVHLPQSLMDYPQRETDAQATSAWGAPAAILLRCGVSAPPPTSDRCYTVAGVDWVISNTKKIYTFTTYGRVPSTQVIVDSNLTNGRSTEALDELSEAIGWIPQSKKHKCDDVLGSSGAGGSATPAPTATPTPTGTP